MESGRFESAHPVLRRLMEKKRKPLRQLQNAKPVVDGPDSRCMAAIVGSSKPHAERSKNTLNGGLPSPGVSRATSKTSSSTAFQSSLRKKLMGSRFRQLNEWMYTTDSTEVFRSVSRDASIFSHYHEGFREQVSKWPVNPLDLVIEWVQNECDPGLSIGDIGCGEARLASTLTDRNIKSFDLVSGNPYITAANMCQLPVDDNELDIAIYCLSLMNTDWPRALFEAFRVLKSGGRLKIVEVLSRISQVTEFIQNICRVGFKLEKKKTVKKFFIVLDLVTTKKTNPVRSMTAGKHRVKETKRKRREVDSEDRTSTSTTAHMMTARFQKTESGSGRILPMLTCSFLKSERTGTKSKSTANQKHSSSNERRVAAGSIIAKPLASGDESTSECVVYDEEGDSDRTNLVDSMVLKPCFYRKR